MALHVEQIYTQCMAEAAYFVACDGEAAIIDPLRDPAPYLDLAKKHNATIKYVIETHFHADFVSGHVDLAKLTGARIIYGPTAEPHFDAWILHDGEEVPLGKAKFTALHTPGHTIESTCFLLHDESGKPKCVFTGDTLFIGDAGRPDLAQKAADMTQEDLAKMLFKSLRTKVMTLPDDVLVYPAHGAGSACGKAMSTETFDTLGRQKLTNYTLRADMSEEEFVKELLDGLRPAPAYFAHQIALNKGDGDQHDFESVMAKGLRKLDVAQFKAELDKGVVAFDCRKLPAEFCEKHIPNTIFAGTSGSLAIWVATVFGQVDQPFVLVAAPETQTEAVARLARVGFDNCIGHLDGGIDAWIAAGEPVASLQSFSVKDVASMLEERPDEVQIVDVRGPGEYRNSHLDVATSAPLCSREPLDFKTLVQPGKRAFMHCVTGYRSTMFLSLCLRNGVDANRVANITGGYAEMKKAEALAQRMVGRSHGDPEQRCPRAA
jgi:hydroxyacylglutathione hydrolase